MNIKIGYKHYEIKFIDTDHMNDSNFGRTVHEEGIIYIRNSGNEEEDRNTLIHEILHAIEYVFCIELNDDDTVRALANGIQTVFIDNQNKLKKLLT